MHTLRAARCLCLFFVRTVILCHATGRDPQPQKRRSFYIFLYNHPITPPRGAINKTTNFSKGGHVDLGW